MKKSVIKKHPMRGTQRSLDNCINQSSMSKVYQSRDDLPQPPVYKTNEEWQKILTEDQFTVLRMEGTENAFDNCFYKHKKKGNYYCVACDNKLFSSEGKYDSGTGWPSFTKDAVEGSTIRVGKVESWKEILCSQCHGHLGHLFNDGPEDSTGERYCINSLCLNFKVGEEK
jgi:peptide-methionine (R)-S-oxide reductase